MTEKDLDFESVLGGVNNSTEFNDLEKATILAALRLAALVSIAGGGTNTPELTMDIPVKLLKFLRYQPERALSIARKLRPTKEIIELFS